MRGSLYVWSFLGCVGFSLGSTFAAPSKPKVVASPSKALESRAGSAISVAAATSGAPSASTAGIDLPLLVDANAILVENVRASVLLYRIACLDAAQLFLVADRVVADYKRGALEIGSAASSARLSAYAQAAPTRLSAAERALVVQATIEPAQMNIEASVSDPVAQLMDYARLVSAVAKSTRALAVPNISPSAERTHLTDAVHTATRRLALTLSNRGYGAARVAAAGLAAHARDASALIADPDVQRAYGVYTWQEVLAKLGSQPVTEIERLFTRGDSGAELLQSIVSQIPRLSRSERPAALVKRLARYGASADTWLSTMPARAVVAAPRVLPVLCFDGARRLAACRNLQRK